MSTAVRAGRLPYKAGANIFIALVVGGAGVIFTHQAIPMDESLGPLAPWGAALLAAGPLAGSGKYPRRRHPLALHLARAG
jgi:hypothetical protein